MSPIALHPAPARPLSRALSRVLGLLGIRVARTVAGVRYREVGPESLRFALSRRGRGHKDFDASFPDGSSMRIRCTGQRHFADLGGPDRLLPAYAAAENLLRPGMRILAARTGTGHIGAWLSGHVGPSGAVVALERDEQSVAYAARRFPLANVGFELGGFETLAGETDGAFDAVLCVDALDPGAEVGAVLGELWRAVAPGGWLLVATPARADPELRSRPLDIDALARELASVRTRWDRAREGGDGSAGDPPSHPGVSAITRAGEPWSIAVVGKPESQSRAGW